MKAKFLFELQQVQMFVREEEPAWKVESCRKLINYMNLLFTQDYI